jgi:hypothetical protein
MHSAATTAAIVHVEWGPSIGSEAENIARTIV